MSRQKHLDDRLSILLVGSVNLIIYLLLQIQSCLSVEILWIFYISALCWFSIWNHWWWERLGWAFACFTANCVTKEKEQCKISNDWVKAHMRLFHLNQHQLFYLKSTIHKPHSLLPTNNQNNTSCQSKNNHKARKGWMRVAAAWWTGREEGC